MVGMGEQRAARGAGCLHSRGRKAAVAGVWRRRRGAASGTALARPLAVHGSLLRSRRSRAGARRAGCSGDVPCTSRRLYVKPSARPSAHLVDVPESDDRAAAAGGLGSGQSPLPRAPSSRCRGCGAYARGDPSATTCTRFLCGNGRLGRPEPLAPALSSRLQGAAGTSTSIRGAAVQYKRSCSSPAGCRHTLPPPLPPPAIPLHGPPRPQPASSPPSAGPSCLHVA